MSNTPTAEEFLRALPPVLRNDRRMMALGQVVAEELSDRMSEIEKAAIYPRIDELDEALLDILAYGTPQERAEVVADLQKDERLMRMEARNRQIREGEDGTK